MKRVSTLLLFLITVNLSFGQNGLVDYSIGNAIKLADFNDDKPGKIYVNTRLDGNGDIYAYLLNRTDSLLGPLSGLAENSKFSKEAIDKDGNWKPIDYHAKKNFPMMICGTGRRRLTLKTDEYTWYTFKKKAYSGNYTTKIRFLYRLNDGSNIVSEPIDASIDYELFLPWHKREIVELDAALQVDTISQNERNKLLERKCSLYYDFESIEETVRVSYEILGANPESAMGRLKFANYLLRYGLQNRKDIGEYQLSLTLSKTFAFWEQTLTKDKKMYNYYQGQIKRFSKFLLTKNDWLNQDKTSYEKIGDKYFAKLLLFDGQLVEIKFRPENIERYTD